MKADAEDLHSRDKYEIVEQVIAATLLVDTGWSAWDNCHDDCEVDDRLCRTKGVLS